MVVSVEGKGGGKGAAPAPEPVAAPTPPPATTCRVEVVAVDAITAADDGCGKRCCVWLR